MFKREAGDLLKDWWASGNRCDLDEFFQVNRLGAVNSEDILNRWISKIPAS
jgi:hypothetical protein